MIEWVKLPPLPFLSFPLTQAQPLDNAEKIQESNSILQGLIYSELRNSLAEKYNSSFFGVETLGSAEIPIEELDVPLITQEMADREDECKLLDDLEKFFSQSETEIRILIEGETGTGKSTLAKRIAYLWAN